jgi:hypothetical protein
MQRILNIHIYKTKQNGNLQFNKQTHISSQSFEISKTEIETPKHKTKILS